MIPTSPGQQLDDDWTVAPPYGKVMWRSHERIRYGKLGYASYPSAVVKKASCKWFSSGSVLITPVGDVPRTINFGDGTCDNKATLTIGDKTIDILL